MTLLLLLLLLGDPADSKQPPNLDHVKSQAQKDDTGDLTIAVAKTFLGKPYVGKTLDQGDHEALTYHFDRFDCVTLVETSLALAMSMTQDKDATAFADELTKLRYRSGRIEDYSSRLHYFTDWGFDNTRKGILTDITQQIGGEPWPKTIDFMSTHRKAYPQLADDQLYARIQEVERNLNQHQRFYIPKDRIEAVEAKIQDGDILALTTGIKGLDIVHTGLAFKKNGRLHMLHASTTSNEVEITDKPLADYTAGIKSQSGIIVYRPNGADQIHGKPKP